MAEAGQQQALPTVPASAVTGLCDDFLNSDAGRQLQDNIRRRVSRRAKTVLTLHEQRACVSVADALRVLGSSLSVNDIMKDAKAFVDRSLRELEPISSRVEREARFACELHRQMPPAVPAASSTTVDPASSKTGNHQEGFAATEQRPSPADDASKLPKADRSGERPSSTPLKLTTTDSRSSGPSTSVNQTDTQASHLSARANSAARVSNPARAVETTSDRRPDKTHEEAKTTQTNADVHKSAGSNSTTTGDDGVSGEQQALNPETAAQLLLKQLSAAPQQKHGSGTQRSTQHGSKEVTKPPHNEISGSGRAHPTTKDADFDQQQQQQQQHPSDDVDSMSDTDVSSVHTSDLSSWSESDHDDTTQEDPNPTSAQPAVAIDMEQDHAAPRAKTGKSGSSRTRSQRPSKRKNTGQKGNDSDTPSKKRAKRAVKRTEEKDATAARSRPRRAAAQGVEKATAQLRDAERDERNERRRASRRSSRRSRGSQEQSPPPAAAAVVVETTVQADVSGSSNHEQNNDQSNVSTDVSNDQTLRRSGRRRAARTSSS